MNTPSHFLMSACLYKLLPKWQMPLSAVLLGSVAPDVALYLLTFGAFAYYGSIGWEPDQAAHHMFDTLYFEDPSWIALHSVLHSPTSLLLLWGLCRLAVGHAATRRWISWFLWSCGLHSLVDILTHHDDGPLLFWPLDWSYRFTSPVSYWHADHFGRQFAVFELCFVVAATLYLVGAWWFVRKSPEP